MFQSKFPFNLLSVKIFTATDPLLWLPDCSYGRKKNPKTSIKSSILSRPMYDTCFFIIRLLLPSHYLQPHSLVVVEEEQSRYSTSVTLHPPLCLRSCLRPPALKYADRIAVSHLLPPNPDSEHQQQAWFTSSLS